MDQRSGGIKRSSWLTFRRRLLLVRLLMRGPALGDALIAGVQAEMGSDGYPAAAASALKHDLDALKAEYRCRITFQRELGGYLLEDLGELALLDLSDDQMEALAFLDASSPAGSALPEQTRIRSLLDRVVQLLPSQRQRQHQQRRDSARLELADSRPGRLDAAVLTAVRRAIEERRELSFKYWSPFDTDAPRRHRVAPYGIFFRPEGHCYLDATLLEVSPAGGELPSAAIDYRIDRIVPGTIQVLTQTLPATRPQPTIYRLRYRLSAAVARRRDVVAYFPETVISYQDDGSALVTARVTNLWQAREILLRYGSACRVVEPAPLVELFRAAVRELAESYAIND